MTFPCLAFVDLETTGAHPEHERITEVGIVFDRDGQIETWSTLVNPETKISIFIQQLTGINDEMVSNAPRFVDVASTVLEKLSGHIVLAHNARFDLSFLKAEFGRLGIAFAPRSACTVKLSRRLYPMHHRHSLDELCRRHQLSIPGSRHRALTDALLIQQFFRVACKELGDETVRNALHQQSHGPELPEGVPAETIRSLPDAPGVFQLTDESGLSLATGRANNLRSRIIGLFREGASVRDKRIGYAIRHIEWQHALGDFGARLKEIRLKRQHAKGELPVFIRLAEAGASLVPRFERGQELPQDTPLLFGPFRSSREARHRLRQLASQFRLCLKGCLLESGSGPCSALAQRHCQGLCCGKESPESHAMRLSAALSRHRMSPWPWTGPVAVIEEEAFTGRREYHLLDQWRDYGSVTDEARLELLLATKPAAPLDVSTYQFLKTHIGTESVQCLQLHWQNET